MGLRRVAAAGTLLLPVLAACGGGEPAAPPSVTVAVGGQEVDLRPTQYCLDGTGQRYSDVVPPIIEVAPDARIALTVPDDVAEQGWAVQVFDDQLEEKLGEVPVGEGEAVFDEITSSDVVPAAFYLVVVEDKGGPCGAFSGAWPVGFLRAGGTAAGSATTPPAG
ncbi:DUF2771 family protein [Geodermatophilus sp. SYSU D00815]